MSRKTFCLIALSAAAFAQEAPKEAPKYYDEKIVERIMNGRGLSERNRKLQAEAREDFETLRPLLDWLRRRFGPRSTKSTDDGPILKLYESVQDIVREDEHSRLYNSAEIHIRLFDGIQDAGRAAAMYISWLSVRFPDGTFSGVPLGDWSARGPGKGSPALLFTRRNAFVRINCSGSIEVWKNDKSARPVSDQGLIHMCEALAQDIDRQIQELPTRRKD